VVISGAGTNLDAILRSCEQAEIDAEVRVVITNRPEAAGLAYSRSRGIPTLVFPRAEYTSREAQQQAMAQALMEHGVELVISAGFDQILIPEFVRQFPNRIITLHPALLPAFSGGLHAVRDALDWGAKVTGCTVFFATDDLDAGPIILQEAVRVEEDDTEESLLTRIHEAEHRILPAAIQLYAMGRLSVEGRRVRILPA
jgi:phosphoribosylglycinamide formyltransferase-1